MLFLIFFVLLSSMTIYLGIVMFLYIRYAIKSVNNIDDQSARTLVFKFLRHKNQYHVRSCDKFHKPISKYRQI
ncbi:hypothetical protein C1646_716658 [Rhizophagus diaphanus]|nr:hypothetical protein C1646_716658 [Rhizophagus diaphanus] [Rhizophagus sp. MUCL 43196]